MRWKLTTRANRRARQLADRHYNRRKVGSPQFVPPAACVVLRTEGAVWVTTWPKYVKHSWPGAWVNTLFRKECAGRASDFIRDAVAATRHELGDPPPQGMVTFVDPAKVRHKRDPGRCYLRAGFERVGTTPGGHGRNPLLVFRLRPESMPIASAPLGAQLRLI